MTKLNVKLEEVDENYLYRKNVIKLGDITVETPINSTDTKSVHSKINEIFKNINFENLEHAIKIDETELGQKFRENKLVDSINFPIVNYTDTVFPTDKHMEMLADLCWSGGDVIVTPSWSKISTTYEGEELLEKIISLNSRFVERAHMKNNKSLIGIIPITFPRFYLEALIDSYYDEGITSFIIDCNGRRSIDTGAKKATWIRELIIQLDQRNENGFLYSINPLEGRFDKKRSLTPAKDYISHSYGIDILGLNHISPNLPPDVWKEISKGEKTYKIFDRETYGYQRLSDSNLRQFGEHCLQNNRIGDDNLLRRACNIEEKNKENLVLKQELDENKSLKGYISSKPFADEKALEKTSEYRKIVYKK
jgi:hypothetical protein